MVTYKEIFRAEELPIFQNRVYETKEKAISCPKGDIVLVQDKVTGLIYNKEFKPELMIYGPDYQNEQSYSDAFKKHIDQVSSIIKRNFNKKALLEIGCGKGVFLEQLLSLGFEVQGIDPAYEGNSSNITKGVYGPSINMLADGIILRHVLEHINDPLGFLDMTRVNNGGRGIVYIEVPCFDWICRHRAWFDIYYEHVNYFRLDDFHRMFKTIYESGYLFNNQYLYVVADLSSLKVPKYGISCSVDMPNNILCDIERFVKITKSSKGKQSSFRNSAIWSGASKGVIFILFLIKAGGKVEIVIDINPAKQGKYLAGSGIQVYSIEKGLSLLDAHANIFIMNSYYYQEIVSSAGEGYTYILVDNINL